MKQRIARKDGFSLVAFAAALACLVVIAAGCSRGVDESPHEVTIPFDGRSVPVANNRVMIRISLDDLEQQTVAINVQCDGVEESMLISTRQESPEVCETRFQLSEILYDQTVPSSARIRLTWGDDEADEAPESE